MVYVSFDTSRCDIDGMREFADYAVKKYNSIYNDGTKLSYGAISSLNLLNDARMPVEIECIGGKNVPILDIILSSEKRADIVALRKSALDFIRDCMSDMYGTCNSVCEYYDIESNSVYLRKDGKDFGVKVLFWNKSGCVDVLANGCLGYDHLLRYYVSQVAKHLSLVDFVCLCTFSFHAGGEFQSKVHTFIDGLSSLISIEVEDAVYALTKYMFNTVVRAETAIDLAVSPQKPSYFSDMRSMLRKLANTTNTYTRGHYVLNTWFNIQDDAGNNVAVRLVLREYGDMV